MSTTPAPTVGDAPAPVKGINAWFTLLFSIPTTISGWLLGRDLGVPVGIGVGLAGVMLVVAAQLIVRGLGDIKEVVRQIDRSNMQDPAKQNAARVLGRARQLAIASLVCNLALLSVLVVLAGPGLWTWLNTGPPKSIQFATLPYFDGTDNTWPADEAPFVEAVISSLAKEGVAEGKRTQILVGATKALTHATPAFRCALDVKSEVAAYQATGYIFRRRPSGRADRGVTYEPVPAQHVGGRLIFSVPGAQPGDSLFAVLRLSLVAGDEFPSEPAKAVSLTILSAEGPVQ